MRIGLHFHGFLGDYKYDEHGNPASSPDGCASYLWSIVCAAIEKGHSVYPLYIRDRDEQGFKKHGIDLFKSFSQWKRYAAYQHLKVNADVQTYPELDVLLLEWRFPIPGRNTMEMFGKPGFQHDLCQQQYLLERYLDTKTKIIIWDLDNKLTADEEKALKERSDNITIFETAVQPIKQVFDRVRVEPPFLMEDVLQHKSAPKTRKVVYIGSRYERDDVIDEWIGPLFKQGEVHFHGKWDDDAKKRWPHITFHPRCGMSDFRSIYSDAAVVPLLAKRSYMQRGFITPRPWEALLFGSLPIGFKGHLGIEQYVCNEWYVANDEVDLFRKALGVAALCTADYERVRNELAHKLLFMDARNFIKRIEEAV